MPQISIITPVHNPAADVLAAMLASVQRQTFTDWEHCIVDDGSSVPHVREQLDAAARSDRRIKVAYLERGEGIVAASNRALGAATGEFIALLDHDDELHCDALQLVANSLDANGDCDYLYTDEDKIDEAGRHFDVFLKPDWSPDRLKTQMYTCHLSVLRRALVQSVGGFRAGFDGSQDWDLVLRVCEQARNVQHVREVLYHWRSVPTSAAADVDAKPYAAEAARKAINEHLMRTSFPAEVIAAPIGGVFTLEPRVESTPLVSIVIPTAGGSKPLRGVPTPLVTNAVRSVLERSTYDHLEFIVVADASLPDAVRRELRDLAGRALRIVDYSSPFNFSEKINMGAVRARGDFILMLNDDVEVLPNQWRDSWPRLEGKSTWIESLLAFATQPDVGAVGAKLYFNDLRLQHCGVVMHGGLPSHPYRGFPSQYPGYFSNVNAVCNYSAVTAACLMVRKIAFEAVGGLSVALPVNYNDVDFCLKLRAHGLRNVYNPAVELLHYESATREATVHAHEIDRIQGQWRTRLMDDPYYHPKFFQRNPDFHPLVMLGDGSFVTG